MQSFLFDAAPEIVPSVPGYPCAFSPDRAYRYVLWRVWEALLSSASALKYRDRSAVTLRPLNTTNLLGGCVMSDVDRSCALPPFPAIDGVRFERVAGFTGYVASDDGVIWSCHISGGKGGIGISWHRLRPRNDRDGYPSVTLFANGKRHTRRVAHIVLEAFVGPRPQGAESCHFPDVSPSNNRADNLRWGTRRDNIDDKIALGTVAKGIDHGMARLTEETVLEIRRVHAETGISFAALGAQFGIHPSHAWDIVKRKAWSHL